MPAELGFGPVLHVLEVHTWKTQASSELQSAKCTPTSPCTCPAARQPWPTGASRSLATCSAARAGAPRACTASRPSWVLPRTTGSWTPFPQRGIPGAQRNGTPGCVLGPPVPRRQREAPSLPHRQPPGWSRSTKVSARPRCESPEVLYKTRVPLL